MNKILILSVIITALVTFILTAILMGSGSDDCIRRLGYINLPDLGNAYDLSNIYTIDSAGNYYSKNDIDTCLNGV